MSHAHARPREFHRTKIVATLGPATDGDDTLTSLLQAGVDVVRLNFSHGTAQDHLARLDLGPGEDRGVRVDDRIGPVVRRHPAPRGAGYAMCAVAALGFVLPRAPRESRSVASEGLHLADRPVLLVK